MVVQNVAHLREHGPVPVADLPGRQVRPADWGTELRTFTITGSPATRTGGNATKIAYLERHDREDVLRCFLDENPSIIENRRFIDFQRLLGKQGRDWKEPSRAIREEFWDEAGDDDSDSPGGPKEMPTEQECPHCGDDVSFGQVPAHIRDSCEAFS
jgi:rubredoxin